MTASAPNLEELLLHELHELSRGWSDESVAESKNVEFTQKLDLLEAKLEKLTQICEELRVKLESRIDIIEAVYSTISKPLNYLQRKFSSGSSSQ